MTPLSTNANAVNQSLKAAMAALFHLDGSGVVIQSINVLPDRNVVIHIDPPTNPFIKGAIKSRMTVGGFHRCVLVTVVMGCQVEWLEIYPVAREALNS